MNKVISVLNVHLPVFGLRICKYTVNEQIWFKRGLSISFTLKQSKQTTKVYLKCFLVKLHIYCIAHNMN